MKEIEKFGLSVRKCSKCESIFSVTLFGDVCPFCNHKGKKKDVYVDFNFF